jgi:hypothetical protein
MADNPGEPPQAPEDSGCVHRGSILVAAAGVMVFVFGCFMFVRADGAPRVHGIREGVQHFYGSVAVIGVALTVFGAILGFVLRLNQRRQ